MPFSAIKGQYVQSANDPMHLHKSFDLAGKWFAASSYELRSGAISPSEGSHIAAYDPWEPFRKNLGKYRTVNQPYVDLLNLSKRLLDLKGLGIKPTSPLSRTLTPLLGPQNDADRIILKWFDEHGALGLVPVLAEKIALPEVITDNSQTQRVHIRDGGIWLTVNSTRRSGSEPAWGGTAWLDWGMHSYKAKEAANDGLEGYFPNVSRVDIPNPQSSEFERVYAEPILKFVEWAQLFRKCVDVLSECDTTTISTADAGVSEAILFLTGLTKAAGPTYQIRKWPISEVRVSAGLLASYALMFLWDLEDGRKALRCRNCAEYFVSNDLKAGYCSPRCRNTAQSRRYRQSLSKTGESK